MVYRKVRIFAFFPILQQLYSGMSGGFPVWEAAFSCETRTTGYARGSKKEMGCRPHLKLCQGKFYINH